MLLNFKEAQTQLTPANLVWAKAWVFETDRDPGSCSISVYKVDDRYWWKSEYLDWSAFALFRGVPDITKADQLLEKRYTSVGLHNMPTNPGSERDENRMAEWLFGVGLVHGVYYCNVC